MSTSSSPKSVSDFKFRPETDCFCSFQTAYGLRCYQCIDSDPKSCTNTMECPPLFDRCSSVELNGNRLFMTTAPIRAFAKFQLFLHSQLLFSRKLNCHIYVFTQVSSPRPASQAICVSAPLNAATVIYATVQAPLVPMFCFCWYQQQSLLPFSEAPWKSFILIHKIKLNPLKWIFTCPKPWLDINLEIFNKIAKEISAWVVCCPITLLVVVGGVAKKKKKKLLQQTARCRTAKIRVIWVKKIA